MNPEKRRACRLDLSVRRIGQIGQAKIRLIEKYLSLYKNKALSAVENAMKCRGET
jgi:hypothetical protein